MGTCSDDECKKNMNKQLDGFRKTLYGETGTNGLVAAVKGKVSWMTLLIIALGIIGVAMADAWRAEDARQLAKNERQLNEAEIKVLKTQCEQTKQDISEIKRQIKELNKKQIDPDHFLQEIKEVIRKNNG